MGIFSKAKKQEDLMLVFDIGSSSVAGAFFQATDSGVPKIIFTTREPIGLEKEINPERFLELTLKTLEKVVYKMATRGVGAPKKVFCVLASPWYASQTRTIKYTKEEPFIFTQKLADSLIQEEIKIFEAEHLKEYAGNENKIRAIELRNMKIDLNGYTVQDPIDKKGKTLEMTVFLSMSPEQILKPMENVINTHFTGKEIKFSSFAMASFAVARNTFVHQDSFLLVDIGGEITDISMVKKDILCSSISFPLGRNFMIREVAGSLNCSLLEAKSYISLYKDGHADEAVEKTLEPIMDKLEAKWLKSFQESLVNLSNDISIPATVFITVDQELNSFFSKIIKTEQFSQYTLTESKFRIIFLGTEALHGIATFQENILRDSFLIIESIYINRFLR
jgi:cell division ATPase FtsA